ncbi:DUF4878 domain-containing protein [Bacteroidales bacterium OttesenSCG-928-C19]|nr:DUF4878 domain-containing protein [Bacteroidales bacterium OttesenSCG-928-C19]
MKKSLKVIALSLFGIILFGACGNNDKKNITQTATNYLNELHKNLDPAKAKAYATPESASFLDMIEQLQGMGGNIEEARKESQNIVIELGEVSIEGETAKVPFTITENGESKEDVLQLKKIDGKWLVHQAKESPMPTDENAEEVLEEATEVVEEVVVEETK